MAANAVQRLHQTRPAKPGLWAWINKRLPVDTFIASS